MSFNPFDPPATKHVVVTASGIRWLRLIAVFFACSPIVVGALLWRYMVVVPISNYPDETVDPRVIREWSIAFFVVATIGYSVAAFFVANLLLWWDGWQRFFTGLLAILFGIVLFVASATVAYFLLAVRPISI